MAAIRVLVTGCNGFIGKNLIGHLWQEGYNVFGWDYTSSKDEWPNVQSYDWVIHLGAIVDPSSQDTETLLQHNLDFSQWLFNECNKWETNFQYASCSSVYGNGPDFSEHAICKPTNAYAWTKYLFDRWVFLQEHKVLVHGIRYFEVYGDGDGSKGENASLIHKLDKQSRNGFIEIDSETARQKRDFVWVRDVCKMHIDLINNVKGSGIWNCGTGRSHSIKEIATAIANANEVELKIVETDSPRKPNIVADLTHLKETIGPRQWEDVIEWIWR